LKTLLHSFYGKLSLTFLVLLLGMGVVQILISVQSSIDFVKEADQRMNQSLAKNLAVDFEPFLGDTMNMPEIEHMMHYLMVINPHIEIYLLDREGQVLAFFAEPSLKVVRESVNLGPVREFISQEGDLAVMGDDPRRLDRQKLFSAAPIKLGPEKDGYIYVILGGEQFDYATASLWDSFLISTAAKGLLIAVICTAVIGLVLFFFMTRRLRTMSAAVKRFEQGEFDHRLEVDSPDEFGRLASTFNKMAGTIESNIDELKRTDDLRRELVANVSHDLRSPLGSVKAHLETIQMKFDSLSGEEKKSYIDISLSNIDRLSRLVHELFELSKLDASQVEPQMEPMAISELVQDVAMKFQPQAERKGLKCVTVLPEGLPLVKADVGMIERVLSNLIENAIHHTEPGGEIRIEPNRLESSVRVSVSDTGSGIAEKDVPHIFDRFYHGPRVGKKSTGTGLGLAIAKKIVELHGGDIRVDTELKRGTAFSFDLGTVSPSSQN